MEPYAKLQADRISVTGPKVDGGYKLTLEPGEQSAQELAKILLIPQNQVTTWEVRL